MVFNKQIGDKIVKNMKTKKSSKKPEQSDDESESDQVWWRVMGYSD